MIKKRLMGLLSHARKYIVYQVIWQWFALLCQILLIYSASMLLEQALFWKVDLQMAGCYGGFAVSAVILRFLCDRQASRASFHASVDVKRILRDKIYEKLLRLGVFYRENAATSEVVQMAAEGVEQLETYFGKYLSQLFYSLLAPITLFVILSFINWKASLVLLICVPLIPISIVMVQKIAKKLLNKYWGIYTELGDSFLENLQGLTTLKIYRSDENKISGKNVKEINTSDLRRMESYVTQETVLFHDSIANNIAVGKSEASREEIIEAAKKASIHDFIMTLPKGYDTEVGELGETLSGGERQRIGIARAFLHDAPFLLLDEPTSNLDSLNEGIIMKSLKKEKGDKTVLLVSHRKSTMNLADVVYEMNKGRLS
ncbi:MAG TPA: ATP-binding cassette domain-containing protein [Candidatus Anaerostipes excrementavium]|uniref:ATP-binding cassette domain-containing protein n=1 Tax=Candidatus Anaerostipes excrementavium TaxID=2838463 RepID=A0A9D1WWB4_9FIRM|nr:ATP-binding cassette domain-containing protein [Candidatus Anaerostipes excrementavium]